MCVYFKSVYPSYQTNRGLGWEAVSVVTFRRQVFSLGCQILGRAGTKVLPRSTYSDTPGNSFDDLAMRPRAPCRTKQLQFACMWAAGIRLRKTLRSEIGGLRGQRENCVGEGPK